MKTLKTNKLFVVLMLASLILSSFNVFAQKKELKTESDGFRWYQLYQNGKYGAQNVNGTTIIPLSRGYDLIVYFADSEHDGSFTVEKTGKMGVCNKNGREIVAPNKYDWVSYGATTGYKYCIVELNQKKGVCDINGKEIIAPKFNSIMYVEEGDKCYFSVELNGMRGAYDIIGKEIISPKYNTLIYHNGFFKYQNASGKYVSTGVTIPKNSNVDYASTTIATNSSTSTSSNKTSGSGGKLLYEGMYNAGPEVYPNGMSSPDAFGSINIKIYENEINILGWGSYRFAGVINGQRKYAFLSNNLGQEVFVDQNYNIALYNHTSVGTSTKQYTRADSPSVNTPQGGYYGGNGGYNSGSTGNNGGNSGNNSSTQQKTHKCSLCNGTGRVIENNGTSFGNTKWCSECGKTVPDYHYHTTCPSCKGKGYW